MIITENGDFMAAIPNQPNKQKYFKHTLKVSSEQFSAFYRLDSTYSNKKAAIDIMSIDSGDPTEIEPDVVWYGDDADADAFYAIKTNDLKKSKDAAKPFLMLKKHKDTIEITPITIAGTTTIEENATLTNELQTNIGDSREGLSDLLKELTSDNGKRFLMEAAPQDMLNMHTMKQEKKEYDAVTPKSDAGRHPVKVDPEEWTAALEDLEKSTKTDGVLLSQDHSKLLGRDYFKIQNENEDTLVKGMRTKSGKISFEAFVPAGDKSGKAFVQMVKAAAAMVKASGGTGEAKRFVIKKCKKGEDIIKILQANAGLPQNEQLSFSLDKKMQKTFTEHYNNASAEEQSKMDKLMEGQRIDREALGLISKNEAPQTPKESASTEKPDDDSVTATPEEPPEPTKIRLK